MPGARTAGRFFVPTNVMAPISIGATVNVLTAIVLPEAVNVSGAECTNVTAVPLSTDFTSETYRLSYGPADVSSMSSVDSM